LGADASQDARPIDARGLRALAATLDHAQKCFVGVFERCAETQEALAFFHPWLQGAADLGCPAPAPALASPGAAGAESAATATRPRPHRVAQHGTVAKRPLDAAQRQEVQRQNVLELWLYRAANAMLDAQLRVARDAQ